MGKRRWLAMFLSCAILMILTLVLLLPRWADAGTAPAPGKQSVEDQDGDGLPDAWERAHGLNPRSAGGINGAAGDPDHDGLPNGDEWANNTDPRRADTDGDGLPDLWEVENGTNPLSGEGNDGANGDPDGDGLLNKDEMGRRADPFNWDTDGDQLPDGWEVVEGLKPTDNRGQNGANGVAAGGRETNSQKFERLNDDFSPPVPERPQH